MSINVSFEKFVEGIKRQAAVLKKHGLMDPGDRMGVPRRYKAKPKDDDAGPTDAQILAEESA